MCNETVPSAGVADQLQTNYAGDLRNILKAVFEINCPPPAGDHDDSYKDGRDSPNVGSCDTSSGEITTEETGSESGTETRTFGGNPKTETLKKKLKFLYYV